MNLLKRLIAICIVLVLAFAANGCKQQDNRLVDGYYTAEMAEYSHGWKEFVTIRVSNGKIVTAEYNAKNVSGFIKSWDLQYMRNMNGAMGTYPNLYTRTYAAELLRTQGAQAIDTLTGATSSGNNFRQMVEVLLEKAGTGDATLGIVGAGS